MECDFQSEHDREKDIGDNDPKRRAQMPLEPQTDGHRTRGERDAEPGQERAFKGLCAKAAHVHPEKPSRAEQIVREDDRKRLSEPEGAQTVPRTARRGVGVYGHIESRANWIAASTSTIGGLRLTS